MGRYAVIWNGNDMQGIAWNMLGESEENVST